MVSIKSLSSFCILFSLVVATIASASSNYGNGYYGYGNNAPKPYNNDVPTKGPLVPPANIIAVQGMIYCKSGYKSFPLKGESLNFNVIGIFSQIK